MWACADYFSQSIMNRILLETICVYFLANPRKHGERFSSEILGWPCCLAWIGFIASLIFHLLAVTL